MNLASGNGNGNGKSVTWQRWILGIAATAIASLIVNGIIFQREMRKEIAENGVKIAQLQQRDENIIKYIGQRMDERWSAAHAELLARDQIISRLEKRLDELERRRP